LLGVPVQARNVFQIDGIDDPGPAARRDHTSRITGMISGRRDVSLTM